MRAMPDVHPRKPTRAEIEAVAITQEWLEERVIERGQHKCWVWTGHVSDHGLPQARITIEPKCSTTIPVRRLVAKLNLARSRTFSGDITEYMRGKLAGVRESCEYGCCKPEHIVLRDSVQAQHRIKGKPINLKHKLAISQTMRAKSRVSDEEIRQMLVDPRAGRTVARELGVSQSYVAKVRAGKLRLLSGTDSAFIGLLVPPQRSANDEEDGDARRA